MNIVGKTRTVLNQIILLSDINKDISDHQFRVYDYLISKIRNRVYMQLLISQNPSNRSWL